MTLYTRHLTHDNFFFIKLRGGIFCIGATIHTGREIQCAGFLLFDKFVKLSQYVFFIEVFDILGRFTQITGTDQLNENLNPLYYCPFSCPAVKLLKV